MSGSPVGYWTLDDGSGTSVKDSSGNTNTGTIIGGATWTAGISGGALQFDGSSYVRMPNFPSLAIGGNAISYGAFYYHTSVVDGFLLGKTVSAYSYTLGVERSAGTFITHLNTGGTVNILRFTGNGLSSYVNSWVHLFVTYDGATIRAYVNGREAGSLAATGAVASNSDDFAIGARGGDGSWTRFNSTIDDVRVYNSALAAADVATLAAGVQAPAPVIASFTVSPGSIVAGSSATLAWTVSNATSVSINQGIGSVAGATSKTITPATTTTYTLTASNGSQSVTATATVTVTQPVSLAGLSCTPASVTGPGTSTCTVTLTGAATTAIDVDLSSSSGAVRVPTSVEAAAGASAATFTATASVVTADVNVTITATLGGISKTASLAVTAAPAPALSSLSCSPGSVAADGSSVCTVALTLPAPSGGATVGLSSNSAFVSVPGSVRVTARSTTASFTANAGSVTRDQTAVVTATLNGVSKTASIAVTATQTVSSFECDPQTMNSGATTTCSVTLTGVRPSAGTTVAISGGGTTFTAPASVTVPAGSASATFTATAASVTTVQSATLVAALGSASKSVTLTVNPSTSSTAGLVGYWRFDEGSGSTAVDASGNGNTATAVGAPTWTTGISGGAIQFNSSTYFRAPSTPSLAINGSAISFGAMYYHVSTTDGFLLGKTVSDYTYLLSVDRGAQQFVVYLKTDGELRILRYPSRSVPNGLGSYKNSWIQLFVTYDGATIMLYVNDTQVAQLAASGPIQSNADAFAIGARGGDGSWLRFNSKIDGVRVYNRTLSAAEVQGLYHAGAAPSNY